MKIPTKKRFIILLADGARHDVFEELLSLGQLPHMAEVFLAEGSFARAATVFPSTTGPAYLPFLTGCFPGTCNIPGIRWFDKQEYGNKNFSLKKFRSYVGLGNFMFNRDIRPEIKTLFDYFSRSFNIFSWVNRGVAFKGNLTVHLMFAYWYYKYRTDLWRWVDEAALAKTLQVLPTDFEFLFAVFPGIDIYSHLSEPRHPQVLEAYQHIDRAVGTIAKELKKEGKWDETALFIVSDHGLSETKAHFGVASFLEAKGMKTFYYPKIFKWGFQAASMVSGNGMLHLYLKGGRGWSERLRLEEIQEFYPAMISDLLENPAVDLVMAQGEEGWIWVFHRLGECRLRVAEKRIFYEPLRGDPLMLGSLPLNLNFRESLEKTASTSYPDSLLQISQLFRSHRTGDLVLSAAKGYDLRKRFEYPEHKSSHGSLHADHMWTPLFSNVKLRNPLVRTADLFPSILQLAGLPISLGLDGESFL